MQQNSSRAPSRDNARRDSVRNSMRMSITEPDTAPTDRRFEMLFEQAPVSIQVLAPNGRTLRVNKAWEKLWQATADNGLLRHVLDEYNVLDDPQLVSKGITPFLQRAMAGESVQMPAIAYHPADSGRSEEPRWVKAQAHPVKDESGAVREVMLIHEDITASVQAEQAMLASELRLKELANTIPHLAWMANPDGFIHWYNDRWYDYTGTTPEQMVGKGWYAVHDPTVLPTVIERFNQSIVSGEAFQMTFPLRGKDGRFRPFLTLTAPLRDEAGQVVQWFGSNTDVSALHDAEQNLRQAEERLRLATLAGNIGIWEWELATDRVTWSDQVYSLHGKAPGSFGGRSSDFSALLHPDDVDAVWQKLRQAIDGDAVFSAEFRVLLPDGNSRWLSTWAQVARDDGGRATRLIGATISIDPYKQAEAALRDGDRRKDEFLAMLAHELRNPLAAISAASQLQRLRLANPEQSARASAIISRQVTHMTELVDDLLDVSRVTRGMIELNNRVVDLAPIIQMAIEQSRPIIDARGHSLTVRIEPSSAWVRGDSARLAQAVANFLTNAAKYTPPGGQIKVELLARGSELELSVTDNGVGIEPALLPQLFQLFVQGARNAGRAEGGLGIGLALVKGIVDLHGGRVEAASGGPGSGSRFTISLPSSRQPEAVAATMAVAPASTAKALRILLVDDNRDAADMVRDLLETAGHEIAVFNDGTTALSSVGGQPQQIFILDIGLPDMDGYELATRLRERAANATFIALTGYGQAQDRQRSAAAGFDHHLVKPVDAQALLTLLASLAPD